MTAAGKQHKTETPQGGTGASAGLARQWQSIDWQKALREVRKLQRRIAKAVTAASWNKVKALQWLLTHSYWAKVLAVRKVTSNRGARTPGVDGIRWTTPAQKMKGASSLVKQGYRARPLRRVLIPKKPGSDKKRPLGIPCIQDRAMQALYQLALEPIAETQADPNSYGFRPYRSTWDAIGQCFCVLGKKTSVGWVFEGDIRACFDKISHAWMEQHIFTDRHLLRQWLKAGYIWEKQLFETTEGTPQGGIISPTLCNVVLDGLEQAIREAVPRGERVFFIRYADDFVVAAEKREVLEGPVPTAIVLFLAVRGLELSPEKTKLTHIDEGFDFLGKHLQKERGRLYIMPSVKNVQSICAKIRQAVRDCFGLSAADLIRRLNPIIRGWATSHRTVQSGDAFSSVEKETFAAVWRWCQRNHPNKNRTWIVRRYYGITSRGRWGRFHAWDKARKRLVELVRPQDVPLVRYIKVRAQSNPHDANDRDYFMMRRQAKNYRPLQEQPSASTAGCGTRAPELVN